MDRKKRDVNSGYLFVVGGPGGSGSSRISKMLSKHFNLTRVYAGEIFRKVLKSKGYEIFEDSFTNSNKEALFEIDNEIDRRLVEEAKRKDILIESKIFSGIADIKDIPCTVKIWLTASLHQRALRHINQLEFPNVFQKIVGYFKERRYLKRRWKLDFMRYWELYGIDYSKPEEYNDIVIDSSRMDEKETFNLILKMLEDGQYIKKN